MKKLFNSGLQFIVAALIATIFFGSQVAISQNIDYRKEAPFGLLCASKSANEKLGITFTETELAPKGHFFMSNSLPKNVSDVEQVYSIFDENENLVKVIATSENFDNDYYGTKVKSRVLEIANTLEKKYDMPKKLFQHTDEYYSGDDFAYGIRTERNQYFYGLENEWLSIYVAIKSSGVNDLYYTVHYERKPEYGQFKDRADAAELDNF